MRRPGGEGRAVDRSILCQRKVRMAHHHGRSQSHGHRCQAMRREIGNSKFMQAMLSASKCFTLFFKIHQNRSIKTFFLCNNGGSFSQLFFMKVCGVYFMKDWVLDYLIKLDIFLNSVLNIKGVDFILK